MFSLSSPVLLAVLFTCLSLAVPSDAYAYLDPGSGSFLLQMLIAGLLGASFLIKTWWRNIKTAFTGLYARHKKSKNDAS